MKKQILFTITLFFLTAGLLIPQNMVMASDISGTETEETVAETEAESEKKTEAESSTETESVVGSQAESETELKSDNSSTDKVILEGNCGAEGDNVSFVLTNDGTLTISGKGKMVNYDDGTCPWSGNSKDIKKVLIEDTVTSIGNNTFPWCSSLTSIEFPAGLTSIGSNAFNGCENLTSIELPEGLTSIGDAAFNSCKNLTSIELPAGLTSIGYSVFCDCSGLTSIKMQKGLKSIGDCAFQNCKNLASIELPEGLTSIGRWAFYGCTNVTSVKMQKGLTSIGYMAFYGCKKLNSIKLPEGLTSIDDYAFYGCINLTSIKLPESLTYVGQRAFDKCKKLNSIVWPTKTTVSKKVTEIDDFAFYNCSKVKTIKLPDKLTKIGKYAFYGCSSLKSINIPKNVKSIGMYAFGECTSLTKIVLPNKISRIACGTFNECDHLTYIKLPEKVSAIGDNAFYFCENLTSIKLPDSVTSIGDCAFSGCGKLTSITIPKGVRSIGESTFYDCGKLTSITIPKGLTSIGNNAFCFCENLTSITIPKGVTSIGENAFEYCMNLTTVNIADLNAYLKRAQSGAFKSNPLSESPNCKIKVSGGFPEDITLNEGITEIPAYLFRGQTKLKSITLPGTLKSIGKDAFYGCTNLEKIVVSDVNQWLKIDFATDYSIPTIYGKAQLYTKNKDDEDELVKSVTTGADVTEIPAYAFAGCKNLKNIDWSASKNLSRIGEGAFEGCDTLAYAYETKDSTGSKKYIPIRIPDTVSAIRSQTFADCSSLHSIIILDNVESIDDEAFDGCGDKDGLTIYGYKSSTDEEKTKAELFYDEQVASGNTAIYFKEYEPESGEQRYKPTLSKDGIGNVSWTLNEKTGLLTISSNNKSTSFYGDGAEYSESPFKNISDQIKSVEFSGKFFCEDIPDYLFAGCTNLTDVKLSPKISTIGNYAFEGCTSLKNITYYSDLKSIGKGAFKNCVNLRKFVQSGNTILDENGDELKGGVIQLSEGITSISEDLFSDCGQIEQVYAFDEIKSIGDSAFKNCASLKTASLFGEQLTSIGASAFENCEELNCSDQATIYLDACKTIENRAFYNCPYVKSVVLSNKITKLGADCIGLRNLGDHGDTTISGFTVYTSANKKSSGYIVAKKYCDDIGALFSKWGANEGMENVLGSGQTKIKSSLNINLTIKGTNKGTKTWNYKDSSVSKITYSLSRTNGGGVSVIRNYGKHTITFKASSSGTVKFSFAFYSSGKKIATSKVRVTVSSSSQSSELNPQDISIDKDPVSLNMADKKSQTVTVSGVKTKLVVNKAVIQETKQGSATPVDVSFNPSVAKVSCTYDAKTKKYKLKITPKKVGSTIVNVYADEDEQYESSFVQEIAVTVTKMPSNITAKAKKSSSTKAKVSWKKVKGASRYQIQVSTSKKFKKAKTKTYSVKANKLSKKVSIKKGKKNYIRVRYKYKGKYSKWSKTITIKK